LQLNLTLTPMSLCQQRAEKVLPDNIVLKYGRLWS